MTTASTATAERQLAPLLGRVAVQRESGIITAIRRKHKRLLCLNEGKLVLVVSNVVEEQFEHVLGRGGVVEPGAFKGALKQAKADGVPVTRLLTEHELVTPGELHSAMLRHVRSLLDSTLAWPNGEYTFAPGQPAVGDSLTVELALAPVLLAHANGLDWPTERIRMKLGPPNATPLIDATRASILSEADRRGAVGFLLEHCNGSADVNKLCEGSPADRDETIRMLYGLTLLGLVEQAHVRTEVTKVDTSVTRAECESLLDADYPDHYAVLGLEKTTEQGPIREAYYYLARRYHPDRFRAGTLQDLLERIEAYFTRVTEAYNTLIDEVLRAEYDTQLQDRMRGEVKPKEDSAHLAKTNYARARVLIDKRRYQDSVQFLENAVKLDDSKAEYHMELGRVLIRSPRRRKDAEEHLRRAIQLDPAVVPAYIALGQLCRKTARNQEAASAFREALRWEPGNIAATEELQAMGLKTGEADEDDGGGFLGGIFRK